jgi:hypothetical protein
MFRFIIIGFVLACAAAQFPYSIDEKIKCLIEYYLNQACATFFAGGPI